MNESAVRLVASNMVTVAPVPAPVSSSVPALAILVRASVPVPAAPTLDEVVKSVTSPLTVLVKIKVFVAPLTAGAPVQVAGVA